MLLTTDEESVCGAQLTPLTKDATQAENPKKENKESTLSCSFALVASLSMAAPDDKSLTSTIFVGLRALSVAPI